MSELNPLPFQVPIGLESLVDDHVLEVHERWQDPGIIYAEHTGMHTLTSVDLGDDRSVRVAVLYPYPWNREDNQEVLVLNQPHAQGWKRSMFIRAELAREIVAQNSPMVVFPNNSLLSRSYNLTGEELAKVSAGDLAPLAELQVRALEKLQLGGRVALTGYSLGGLLAPAIAAVGSDKFEVKAINADEAPNKERTPSKLRQDFMKSGGWSDQRLAITEASIPALGKALTRPRMALDYAGFGLATQLSPENRALYKAMTQLTLLENLTKARQHYPGIITKLGYIAGSKLFDPEMLLTRPAGVRPRFYRGDATHMHPTGDNVMAHALMVKDGLKPVPCDYRS